VQHLIRKTLPLLKIFTDGASRNNPGHAGIGIAIYDENNFIVKTYKEYIGKATNNQAEYIALIKCTEQVKKLGKDEGLKPDFIEFYSDSELLVNQINFDYKVKDADLALLNNNQNFHLNTFALGHGPSRFLWSKQLLQPLYLLIEANHCSFFPIVENVTHKHRWYFDSPRSHD